MSDPDPRPLIIPIFLPHFGCPHRCLFCNQNVISGRAMPTPPDRVHDVIRSWLDRDRGRRRAQVAFYGGSFTGLARELQDRFLAVLQPWLRSGRVGSIRISTRPDRVDAATVERLRRAGVTTIELGVQSMDEEVLRSCHRDHTPGQVRRASTLIREAGLELGHQLMLGLPGQGFSSLRRTVEAVIALAPDLVRIYPVLVVRDAPLERLYNRGAYRPLSLSRAVLQAAWMCERLEEAKIRVIRMGLQPEPELERSLVAGPYHPAFGELVRSRIMFRRARALLATVAPHRRVRLVISARDQSLFRGQNAANIHRLTRLGLSARFSLRPDPDQQRFTLRIEPQP